MDIFKVNKKTCLQDGICADTCPPGIIDFQPDDYPRPSARAEKVCIKCGHCVAVCPTGSLSHLDMPVEQCAPLQETPEIDIECFEYFLRRRRSIRAYQDRPVPRDVLMRLIEVARYGPSAGNRQSVEWLVVEGREKVRHLAEIGADWMKWMISKKSPMAPFLRRMLKRREKGKDEFLRDAPAVVVAHGKKGESLAAWNCAIALTNFELAANCMGLGCCCIGFVIHAANTYPPFAKALSLPKGHDAYGCLIVGYPRYRYHRLPVRKPPDITWV